MLDDGAQRRSTEHVKILPIDLADRIEIGNNHSRRLQPFVSLYNNLEQLEIARQIFSGFLISGPVMPKNASGTINLS
jgi:hypothetical protein